VQQIFYKRLLPNYDVFDEHRYFEPGLASNFSLDHIRIGVTICEDWWNDEEFWGKRSYAINPIADLAELGVDLMVNLFRPTASASSTCGKRCCGTLLSVTGNPLYVNQVGANDDPFLMALVWDLTALVR